MDMNCSYCAEGKLVDAFGIKIGELPASKVYLFKEQSHKGRCIVASKFHVSEMIELSADERNAFMDDVCKLRRQSTSSLLRPRSTMALTAIPGTISTSISFRSTRMGLSGEARLK